MTLLLSVLPCLALGIVTLVRRSSRAAAIVPANRRVSGSQRIGGGK
jgi:hypothetical protein